MSKVIDSENGIWITEMPVRAQDDGYVVMCNEEQIGFAATYRNDPSVTAYRTRFGMDFRMVDIGGFDTVEQAARAIAYEVFGDFAFSTPWGYDERPDAYERAVNDYILTGKGAG